TGVQTCALPICSLDMTEELVSPSDGRLNSLAASGAAVTTIRDRQNIFRGDRAALKSRMGSLWGWYETLTPRHLKGLPARVILADLYGVYACSMKKVNGGRISPWTPAAWPVRCRCCGPRWRSMPWSRASCCIWRQPMQGHNGT